MNNNLTEPYVSAGQLNIPAGIFFTRQPQRAAASDPDQTAVFKVTAINAVSYQWQYNDGSGWTDLDGAESDTFEIVIGPGMHGWQFRCVVEDADGASAASSAAAITVYNTSRITVSGAIATIDYGPVNIYSLVADIDAVQPGTGDPSPENIRPISGWDTVTVTRTGKNLSSVATANYTQQKIILDMPINFKKVYTYSATATNTGTGIGRMTLQIYNGITLLRQAFTEIPVGTSQQRLSITVDLTSTDFDKILLMGNGTTSGYDIHLDDIQVEIGSTATDYESYNGTTYPITLSDTCYGGTLDVTSGVLTVTHGYIASYVDEDLPGTWISDRDVYAEGTAPTAGAEVVYELAEPITVTLTATEVSTILGSNNIFADSGEVKVIYQGWPNAEPESEFVGLGSLNPNAIQDVLTPGVIEDIPQTLDITPEFDTLL